MLPASVQLCPVELPGRGRRQSEPAISDSRELARVLARSLPLADKPYAVFGTCLGAIVGYEMAREVDSSRCAPMPLVLFSAVVSPPHLYARAVARLYHVRRLRECWGWRLRAALALLPAGCLAVPALRCRPAVPARLSHLTAAAC